MYRGQGLPTPLTEDPSPETNKAFHKSLRKKTVMDLAMGSELV